MMWQVEVPMMATIWPGSVALAAGAVDVGVDVADATAMPSGSPVQAAARAVSVPARSPRALTRLGDLVVDEAGEIGVEGREIVRTSDRSRPDRMAL